MIPDRIGGLTGPLASLPATVPDSPMPGAMPGAGSADAQQFAALLQPHQGPAAAVPQPAVQQAAYDLRLAPPPGPNLGDAILNSLQRFSQSAQGVNKPASGPAALLPGPAAAAPGQGSAQGGAKTPSPLDAMDHLFNQGMESQAKMYTSMFDLGLVEASTESINKSLKTLITQGGG